MNIVKTLLVLLSLFLFSVVNAEELGTQKAQRILDASGLAKQVIEIPGLVISGMEEARKGDDTISDSEFTAMKHAASEAFTPGDMIGHINSGLIKHLSQSEVDRLMVWYESDLGKKITQAEVDASTPEAFNDMVSNAQTLVSDQLRVNLALQMEELLNTTDLMIQIQKQTSIAVVTAIYTAMYPDQPVDLGPVEEQMQAHEKQMRESLYQVAILSFVYSYRAMDLKDIETYIAFLSENDSRKFHKIVKQSYEEAFSLSIDKMAKSLASIMTKPKDNNI